MQRVPVIYLSSSMEALLSINACSPIHQLFTPLSEVEALLVVTQSRSEQAMRICHSAESAPYASRLKTKCATAAVEVQMQRHLSSCFTLLAGLLFPHRPVSVMELRLPVDRNADDYMYFGKHIAQGVARGVAVICFDRHASRENLGSQCEVLDAIRALQELKAEGRVSAAAGIRGLMCTAVGVSGKPAPSRVFGNTAGGQPAFSGCAWL